MERAFDWESLNSFLLKCGSVHEPHRFVTNALEQLQPLVPFDQGRAYFINKNAQVYDEFLLGVDRHITKAYHMYYSRIQDGQYSAVKRSTTLHPAKTVVCDWTAYPKDQFIEEHLRPQGIRYSTGFCLYDMQGMPAVLFCMDRTSRVNYSPVDCRLLDQIKQHLDNLFRNFYVPVGESQTQDIRSMKTDTPLTKRETEIALLLKDGVSPENIAQRLCISLTTVYKHIAHIHKKLHVSNRQQLLVKLLFDRTDG